MNTRKALVTAAAAAAMLLNSALPAFAATDLIISGNGDSSDNYAQVKLEQNTSVVQTNETSINNDIDANASTGGNSASRNTGGDNTVDTGNASTVVNVENTANSNVAEVDCCDLGDTNVEISGNGVDSDNDVKLKDEGSTTVVQDNTAKIYNDIDADARTGYNSSDRNTGGSSSVYTGDAEVGVGVSTVANANVAKVGGGDGGRSLHALITNNGDSSDNDLRLRLGHDVVLQQYNEAKVSNDIDADAKTGNNSTDRNTGGDNLVDTGNAEVLALVDNMVNFNAADVDCGCLFDELLAKIHGNGVDTDNDLKATLGDSLSVFQDNSCKNYGGEYSLWDWGRGYGKGKCLDNDLDLNAVTGKNDSDRNTGEGDGDPAVYTGNSSAEAEVTNTAGSNVYGDLSGWEWPWDGGNHVSLDLTFDLHDLLEALGLLG
jgi:hypothetical protein